MPVRICLPHHLIVGIPKCGTTALATFLQRQSKIHLGKIKEPGFFQNWCDAGTGACQEHEALIKNSLGYYASLFPADALPYSHVYFEATSNYSISETAIQRISQWLPDAKLIVLVRDPIDRAYSQWMLGKKLSNQTSQCEPAYFDTNSFDQIISSNLDYTQECIQLDTSTISDWSTEEILIASSQIDTCAKKGLRKSSTPKPRNTCEIIANPVNLLNLGIYATHWEHLFKHIELNMFHFVVNEDLLYSPVMVYFLL